MYVILSQKVDTESSYSDKLFNVYHYPARYKNQLHEGDIFVYYQGNRCDKSQRYYFGVGIIEKISMEDVENYYATLKDCQIFPVKVPIYLPDGGYAEQLGYQTVRKSLIPPWQTSVRPLAEEAFNYIIAQAGISFVTEENKDTVAKLNSDLKAAIRAYFVDRQNNEIAHIAEIANDICGQLHISKKEYPVIQNEPEPQAMEINKDLKSLIEYCKTMHMSYSYKPVLILALLAYADESGNISIEKAARYFKAYYAVRKNNGLTVEKNKCIYLNDDVTDDEITANIIANPVRVLSATDYFTYDNKTGIFSLKNELYKALDAGIKGKICNICSKKLDAYYHENINRELITEINSNI